VSERYKGKFRIDSLRLQNWNYANDGAYFITICTKNRENYFGKIVKCSSDNNEMILSNCGVIADLLWFEIKNHAKNVELGPFIVMPNHIHGILILKGNNVETKNDIPAPPIVEARHALPLQLGEQSILGNDSKSGDNSNHSEKNKTIGQQRFQNQGKNTISSIVGSYKSAVSKHCNRLGFNFAWQTNFYEHIIRDGKSFENIQNYIESNVQNWTKDEFSNNL
jgi:REP element-mobilizing transposase RayT